MSIPTCGICFNTVRRNCTPHQQQQPELVMSYGITLPTCGHTYCKECITSGCYETCPTCRTPFPRSQLQFFGPAHVVTKILPTNTNTTATGDTTIGNVVLKTCEWCGTEEAVVTCLHASCAGMVFCSLCDSDVHNHPTARIVYRTHTRVPYTNKGGGSAQDTCSCRRLTQQNQRGSRVSGMFYCFTEGGMLRCERCVMASCGPQGHDVIPASNIGDDAKTQPVDELKKRKETAVYVASRIDERTDGVIMALQQSFRDIRAVYEEQRRRLAEKEESDLQQCLKKHNVVLKELQEARQAVLDYVSAINGGAPEDVVRTIGSTITTPGPLEYTDTHSPKIRFSPIDTTLYNVPFMTPLGGKHGLSVTRDSGLGCTRIDYVVTASSAQWFTLCSSAPLPLGRSTIWSVKLVNSRSVMLGLQTPRTVLVQLSFCPMTRAQPRGTSNPPQRSEESSLKFQEELRFAGKASRMIP